MFEKLFKKNKAANEIFLEHLLKKGTNTKILSDLLENEEVDINYRNIEGESFLHICLKAKKIQNAMWLISKGIKLNTFDNQDISPFDIAISNQNHKIVRLILKKIRVDLNKKNEFGRTLLQDSVILGDHEMAKILINNGADINIKNNKNRNVLYDALSYNNETFTNYLLNLNKLELNNLDIQRDTLLNHKSVKNNSMLAMKLITKGANPTILARNNESFLYQCALNGIDGLHIIIYAVENGYDINTKVRNDDTIFTVLIDELLSLTKNDEEQEDKRKIIRYQIKELIARGLDVNALTKENETALYKAIRANNEILVELLLSLKININTQNNKKQTPLAVASHQGVKSLKIIIELLKHNADPTIRNNEEKCLFEEINDIVLELTPHKELLYIEKLNQKQISLQYLSILKEILKYYKRNLDYLDSQGNPLFYKPIMYHHFTLFHLYTNKGLDIHKLNKDGHNIFFEYLMKVFRDNNENIDFQGVLNILLSAKVNHNTQDETGWTAISKIIATTQCNLNLFKLLIKVVKFDYTITDKLGRTAIHSAVWKGNYNIIKVINFIDSSIKNIPDNYGILPITYAALLGNQELVLTLTSLKSKTTTDYYIVPAAVNKFKPMLLNLEKLTKDIKDPLKLKQINDVINNTKEDFNLEGREDV